MIASGKSDPDLPSPQELFARIVQAAVSGAIPPENASDLIGEAVVSMIGKMPNGIGLRREFEECLIALKHMAMGIAAAKLAEMKRAAELMARTDDEDTLG